MPAPTIDPARLAALPALDKGAHPSADEGLCMVEAAAWITGEPHSDHPACVSPAIAAYCRALNDQWDTTQRQKLVPFLTRIVGTAGDPALEQRRSWLAADWLVRTYTPAWLTLAGLGEHATAMRELAELVDVPSAQDARTTGAAAWTAAWTAAGDAAWAAARAAAGDAARDALAPTVVTLQASALDLLDRMIALSENPS